MAGKNTGSTTVAPGQDADPEPLADETAQRAREVVASYSADAEECRMLLSMLGIDPQHTVD